ncbi:MAG: hypothetical protein ACRERV_09400 [Methylococcales bacterium]
MTRCPKCQYQRLAVDSQVHSDICPACGIVYSKWLAKQNEVQEAISIEPEIRQSFFQWLTEAPEKLDDIAFWARAICALLFAIWTLYFIVNGISWEVLGGSFMHNVNLIFHEFGHLFFRPFGEFMTILGGSLFQVIWPWTFLFAFLFKYSDTFAASLMLWWSGQSFVDLSPYIADAYYRGLPLVGGGGEESHDWGNLLTMMDMLESHMRLARISFFIGSVMMVAALVWAALVLRQQWQVLKQSA